MYDNLCTIKLCYTSEVRLSIGFQEFCRNFFVNENGTSREIYILIPKVYLYLSVTKFSLTTFEYSWSRIFRLKLTA